MKSVPFQEEFYRNGKGIVADLWSTNFQSMKGIILSIPLLEEQKKIADYLDCKIGGIDKMTSIEEEINKKLLSLKQSLISEVVTGKIDVRNVVIPKCEKAKANDNEEINEMESVEIGN